MDKKIHIRMAGPDDTGLILQFIKGLAEYERLSSAVVATEEELKQTLFSESPHAEVILAFADQTPAGFCLFFHNYSTFLAKRGLYIEDLFVAPEMRGLGIGLTLFREAARIAATRDCGRMEWAVLDWNEPAIGFYKKMGAKPLDEWTTFRLTETQLCDL